MKKDNPTFVALSTLQIEDYQEIIEYAKAMQTVADFLHCDIADGVFVPTKSYDASLIKTINSNSLIALDVHLMVDEPFEQIDDYLKAGANVLTLQYEAFKDKNKLAEAVKKIKSFGILSGLALNPETTLQQAKNFLYTTDIVLLLSVNPGFPGQKFIPEVKEKIKELRDFRETNNLKFKIEVDGGVNEKNAKELRTLGADILVSGSFVYNSLDRKVAIDVLKS